MVLTKFACAANATAPQLIEGESIILSEPNVKLVTNAKDLGLGTLTITTKSD